MSPLGTGLGTGCDDVRRAASGAAQRLIGVRTRSWLQPLSVIVLDNQQCGGVKLNGWSTELSMIRTVEPAMRSRACFTTPSRACSPKPYRTSSSALAPPKNPRRSQSLRSHPPETSAECSTSAPCTAWHPARAHSRADGWSTATAFADRLRTANDRRRRLRPSGHDASAMPAPRPSRSVATHRLQ
jgi:hypothetical protein